MRSDLALDALEQAVWARPDRDGLIHHSDRGVHAWDRSDREYCLPTCGDVSTRPIGRVTLLASAREARALGLRPCRDCRPDLHPLAG